MKMTQPKHCLLVAVHHALRYCLLMPLALCIAPSQALAAPQEVKHIDIVAGPDKHMAGLLKLALSYSDKKYLLTANSEALSRTRAKEYLESDRLSVIWGGTSTNMEDEFLPIRIPAFKGLLGYRLFIIRPELQSQFNQVKTLEDLKKFTFGQGRTWADTKILLNAGLTVVPAKATNNLLHMTDGNRFDAFPRGAHEPWSELKRFPELGLAVEKDVMLIYKLAYYFFLNKDNYTLAQEITNGLEAAISDGSFDEYFYKSPMVKSVLKQAEMENRIGIHINNPFLPPKTPVDRDELWFDPSKITPHK